MKFLTGEFIMKFGLTGSDKIQGTSQITFRNPINTAGIVLVWNDINSAYEGTNVELATELINDYPDGSEGCFAIFFLTDLFIHYKFETISTSGVTI